METCPHCQNVGVLRQSYHADSPMVVCICRLETPVFLCKCPECRGCGMLDGALCPLCKGIGHLLGKGVAKNVEVHGLPSRPAGADSRLRARLPLLEF